MGFINPWRTARFWSDREQGTSDTTTPSSWSVVIPEKMLLWLKDCKIKLDQYQLLRLDIKKRPDVFWQLFSSLLFPVKLKLGLSQADNEQRQLGASLLSDSANEIIEIQMLNYCSGQFRYKSKPTKPGKFSAYYKWGSVPHHKVLKIIVFIVFVKHTWGFCGLYFKDEWQQAPESYFPTFPFVSRCFLPDFTRLCLFSSLTEFTSFH